MQRAASNRLPQDKAEYIGREQLPGGREKDTSVSRESGLGDQVINTVSNPSALS
jgi:hypothetical protein